ncbi:caspase family protein [Reichenbachiella agarivorans]|uniref:Caspase family protein n=1 Tax=Reichenbachiella agarivorans TaxID=2979464 RepID=A0ABY6CT37_9BACT|nr:caspase family protein [Reichenbachiella agarivorans]UXP33687.1 caspase family protein [Reichenbachiella agarivorans]
MMTLFRISYFVLFLFHGLTLSAQEDGGSNLSFVLKPKGHKGLIHDLSITPDGKQVVTAGRDKTVRLWDVNSYEQRGEILGHIGQENYGSVSAARVSPDGRYIATAGLFGDSRATKYLADIRVYDFHSQKMVHVFAGHQKSINCLRWSRDSRYIISASNDGYVGVWDLKSKELKQVLKEHGDAVWCADVFGDKIVSGSQDNLVHLTDLNTGQLLNTSYDHVGTVIRVVFDPTGRFILSGGDDNQINVYDADLNYLSTLYLKQTPSTISFDSAGQLALIGFNNGSIQVYKFDQGQLTELANYRPHKGAFVAGIEMTTDRRIFSAGGMDSNIAVYQLREGGVDSLTNIVGSTQKVWGAGLNEEILAFSTGAQPNGYIPGLKDVDFSHGFNFVSREYATMDPANNIFKATIGGTFKERSASFKGRTYQYKVPILELGGLRASKNGNSVFVKYLPDPSLPYQMEVKGKFVDFQYGDIPVSISDNYEKYSLTFTPDSLLLVGGSGGYLQAYNLNGEMVTKFEGHEDVVFTINLSTDDRWIISGSHDQSIRLWDAQKVGKQKFLQPAATCFFSKEGEWIVVTEQGYYMSSTRGGQYVGFHQNQGFREAAKYYPFENFDLKYNRPDLVLEVLGMGSDQLRELIYKAYQKRVKKMGLREEDISGELNLPTVRIDGAGQTVKDKFYTLKFTAADDKLMLDRIHVYVNDIPIFGIKGISVKEEVNRQKIYKSIPVELTAGKNKIQVSTMNISGIESLKETVIIYYEGADPKPDLHVVTIGVSNYKDSQYDLTYASKDATDIANLFFGHHQRYNQIHIHRFTDALAQREQILAVKEKLLKTKVEDEVILFMAGHGLLDDKLDYYFATQDIDFSNPSGRGLKYEELEGLLDGIPARQKLMLIDACHSGEVDKEDTQLIASSVSTTGVSTRGFAKKPQPIGINNTFELMQELFADLRRGTGAMVISSASGVEFAFESPEWQNGVFTYALLEGLKSGNCDKNLDGEVQISELKNYVFDRVEQLTNGKQHPTSRRENLEFDFVVW